MPKTPDIDPRRAATMAFPVTVTFHLLTGGEPVTILVECPSGGAVDNPQEAAKAVGAHLAAQAWVVGDRPDGSGAEAVNMASVAHMSMAAKPAKLGVLRELGR